MKGLGTSADLLGTAGAPYSAHSMHAPTPSRQLKKTVRKAWNDIRLFVKGKGVGDAGTVLGVAVLVTVALVYMLYGLMSGGSARAEQDLVAPTELQVFYRPVDMENVSCSCPSSSPSALRRFETQLEQAHLVARANVVQVLDDGLVQMRIDAIYRGLPRLSDFDILVAQDTTLGCYNMLEDPERGAPGYSMSNSTYLIIAGRSFGVDNETDYSARILSDTFNKLYGKSVVSKFLHAPRTPTVVRGRALSVLQSHNSVWGAVDELPCGCNVAVLWNSLGKEFIDLLLREREVSQLDWWRHKAKPHSDVLAAPPSLRAALANMSEEKQVSVMRSILRAAELSNLDEEWWSAPGVSLIAACKDRNDHVLDALASWRKVAGLKEIVIVDWSSKHAVREFLKAHRELDDVLEDTRIRIERVEGEVAWVLSRAYNLAARLSVYSNILKVDCDTVLHPDLLSAHPLKAGTFYAGDWKTLNSNNLSDSLGSAALSASEELHLNGMLFVRRSDFFMLGGYDERIVTYGWDDTDMVRRLVGRGLANLPFNNSFATHAEHPYEQRLTNQPVSEYGALLPSANPLAAAVEVQRNRVLGSKMNLPTWDSSSLRTYYNLVVKEASPRAYLQLTAANKIQSLQELVSNEQLQEASKKALRIILKERFGFGNFPRSFSVRFLQQLSSFVALPEKHAHFFVHLHGSCARRIIQMTALRALVERKGQEDALELLPPGESPHLIFLSPRNDECLCPIGEALSVKDIEMYESADPDKMPPVYDADFFRSHPGAAEAERVETVEEVLAYDWKRVGSHHVKLSDHALQSAHDAAAKRAVAEEAAKFAPSNDVKKSLLTYDLSVVGGGARVQRLRHAVGSTARLHKKNGQPDDQALQPPPPPPPLNPALEPFASMWRGHAEISELVSNVNAILSVRDCSIHASKLSLSETALMCDVPELLIVLTALVSSNGACATPWWLSD
ncbi:hypothetical protein FVE85_0519 [Porphyridium purpureum]|uniref:Galactosyltransferase C-terminal domain-containing protein n=1 Tax=Porphyridium purpureum TaxID=35688 RepID=A0A5J4Z0L8_PORPP|nr:hypothetical protein FVE85_0519 [Porphyridium purpureum]|eukprot:POR5787..scf208_2